MNKKNDNEFALMTDESVKNMFTNANTGKRFSALVIANTIGVSEEEIYNNLEYIPNRSVVNKNVVNNEMDISYEADKILINIEYNKTYHGKPTQVKNEGYICSLYLKQIPSQESYKDLKQIIQINIDGYDYFKKGKFLYESVLMERNLHLIESENIKIYHINLPYLVNMKYNNIKERKNKLEELLYILVCKDKDKLNKIYNNDKFMIGVIKDMERNIEALDAWLYYDKEELERLDQEWLREEAERTGLEKGMAEGMKQGMKQGIEQGVVKGISQRNIEIAKSLLASNMSIEEISHHTGLSFEEIEKIK